MATTLIVLGLDNRERGEEVFDLVTNQLTKQELIKLGDAALVWRDADGKVKVQQAMNTTAAGAAGGALWGALFGLIFLMPIFGMAIGAASGAIAGKLTDIGVDDKMIKQLGEQLTPGRAAVFMLVVSATRDKVIEALRPYSPTVLQSNLTHDDQAKLVAALTA
ncbi:DUF1269 domain-containing protein [Luedemannella flava]|uniref:DUF1269 domain-containing protein n=1 Tax=Luedemannella flava TaxID=349316 RepID=A0ABN2LHB8_9ACTN